MFRGLIVCTKDGEESKGIGKTSDYTPGDNTYEKDGNIYSSVIGSISIHKTPSGLQSINVIPKFKEVDKLYPEDIVYCEVLRVEPRYVRTKIIATESKVNRNTMSV